MSRVRRYFLSEAERWMAELREQVGASPLNVDASYRAIRRLRGNAQMARFGGLAKTARQLEARLRPHVGQGSTGNEAGLRQEIRSVLESLEQGVDAVRSGRLVEDPKVEVGMDEQRTDDQGLTDQGMTGQGVGGRGVRGPGAAGEPAAVEGDVVSVETLEYQGAGALERALSLRESLENAIVDERRTGPILDELFDLIRLGSK